MIDGDPKNKSVAVTEEIGIVNPINEVAKETDSKIVQILQDVAEIAKLDPHKIADETNIYQSRIRFLFSQLAQIDTTLTSIAKREISPILSEEQVQISFPILKQRLADLRGRLEGLTQTATADSLTDLLVLSTELSDLVSELTTKNLALGEAEKTVEAKLISLLKSDAFLNLLSKTRKSVLEDDLKNFETNHDTFSAEKFEEGVQWIIDTQLSPYGVSEKTKAWLAKTRLGKRIQGGDRHQVFLQVQDALSMWKQSRLTHEECRQLLTEDVGEKERAEERHTLVSLIERIAQGVQAVLEVKVKQEVQRMCRVDVCRSIDDIWSGEFFEYTASVLTGENGAVVNSIYKDGTEREFGMQQMGIHEQNGNFVTGYERSFSTYVTSETMTACFDIWKEKFSSTLASYQKLLQQEIGFRSRVGLFEQVHSPSRITYSEEVPIPLPPRFAKAIHSHPAYSFIATEIASLQEDRILLMERLRQTEELDVEDVDHFLQCYRCELNPNIEFCSLALKLVNEIYSKYYDQNNSGKEWRWRDLGKNLLNLIISNTRQIYESGNSELIKSWEKGFSGCSPIVLEAIRIYGSKDYLIERKSNSVRDDARNDLFRYEFILKGLETDDNQKRKGLIESLTSEQITALFMPELGRSPYTKKVDNPFKGDSVIIGLILKNELLRRPVSIEIFDLLGHYMATNFKFVNNNTSYSTLKVLSLLVESNLVDWQLIERGYENDYFDDPSLLQYIPEPSRTYCSYYIGLPSGLRPLLHNAKEEFSTLVINGKETQAWLQRLMKENQGAFLTYLTKDRFAVLVGQDKADAFLEALPKKTEERRNAFLHNNYDRTTAFLDSLRYSELTHTTTSTKLYKDIDIVTNFVKDFGLARSGFLFEVYKLAYLQEHSLPIEPPDSVDTLNQWGVHSTEQIQSEVIKLRNITLGVEPLTAKRLKEFSPFQLQLLEVITGKASHRWDLGRPLFESIITDYIAAEEAGDIEPLPKEYQPCSFKLSTVTIEYDPTPILAEFGILRSEIQDGIEHSGQYEDLVIELTSNLISKIEAAQTAMEKIPQDKRKFSQQNIDRMKMNILKLREVSSLDRLLFALLQSDYEKADFAAFRRRIGLRRVFQNNYSPEHLEEVARLMTEDPITPQAILAAVNVVDEYIKHHALNIKTQGESEPVEAANYWTPEIVTLLLTTKQGEQFVKSFNGYHDTLKKSVDDFTVRLEESQRQISAIPSRDAIAEFSGYLADVCYTSEYPLLKGRKVVPYKFVNQGETPDSGGEFGGSVLVFEVTDEHGDACLLVRGFDYKEDSTINLPVFVEGFFDELAQVGRKLGKKRILVPGSSGAISNYTMTYDYIMKKYCTDSRRVNLVEKFNFNNYDLTNNCYVAREIT